MTPTPADLAGLRRPSVRLAPDALTALFRRNFPSLVGMLELIGIDAQHELSKWAARDGAEHVGLWLDLRSPAASVVENLQRSSDRVDSPIDELVREAHLSARPTDLGPYFRQYGKTFATALLEARTAVGFALFRWGWHLGYKRQEVMLRTFDLARTYFRDLLYSQRIQGISPEPQTLRRLGASTVASGRFKEQSPNDIQEAADALLASIELGEGAKASELYIEAQVQLYDATGDRNALIVASALIESPGAEYLPTATWHLNAADVYARMVEGITPRSPHDSVTRAQTHIARAERILSDEPVQRSRFTLMKALVEHLRVAAHGGIYISCRGLNLPFGSRHGRSMNAAAASIQTALINAVYPLAVRGEYIYRDLCADLLSQRARSTEDNREKLTDLRAAVKLRTGSGKQKHLEGGRVSIAQAEDFLLLGALTGSGEFRTSGAELLLHEAVASPTSAVALVLLAKDVQQYGALPRFLSTSALAPTPLVTAIRAGDAPALYGIAANRALANQDLTRRQMGGRGNVVIIDDPSGLSGRTLVFKWMTVRRWKADLEVSQTIQDHLKVKAIKGFGIVEHLASVPSVETLDSADPESEIVSVREFVSGATLRDHLRANPADRLRSVTSTVKYLATIQKCLSTRAAGTGVRRQLKEGEVGRWLRKVAPATDWADIFDRWWLLIADAPLLPRRDSHALNWLVDGSGTILAADLDCVGWRPFGYELAQLTEDHAIFEPADDASRQNVLSVYRRELAPFVDVSDENAAVYYEAGMVARTLFQLSHSGSSDVARGLAMRTLDHLRRNGTPRVRPVASAVFAAWASKTGVASARTFSALSDADRHRISRGMAYHLRHDIDAPLTKDGWIFIEDLVALMVRSKFKVTAEQLVVVANAVGETRFEMDGDEIRATHGHSLPTSIQYAPREPPRFLFHGTSIANLQSIVEARDGLRPMKRRRVHLTTDPQVALHAAARRRSPVILMQVESSSLKELNAASETIWLVEHVPANLLRVVPVWEASAMDVVKIDD